MKRTNLITFCLFLFLMLVVTVSLLFNVYIQKEHTLQLAEIQAKESYRKDSAYRRWNSMAGGVFVKVSDYIQPNPYLDIPNRDFRSESGDLLTTVNPAFMTRMVYEINENESGIKGKVTSLDPIRPGNAPDEFEIEALKQLERETKEAVYEVEPSDEGDLLRAVYPFYTEQSCLKCHGDQGYQVGDLRGAISIRVPMDPFYISEDEQIAMLLFSHLGFYLAGCGIIGFLFYVMKKDDQYKKSVRDELLKAKNLESLGVLAGGIAHDYNNLLTGIIGNLSLSKSYLPAGDKACECIEEAEKASERAARLTQQLLTFSKGGAPVKKTNDIRDLIEDTARFCLRGSNVSCGFEFDERLWLADIDRGQISQVIQNLVINAAQAMPNGGEIRIKAANEELGRTKRKSRRLLSLSAGRYIAISIRDQGCGIERKDLDRIFDPYYTTKRTGSGLGLASCHSIVKAHGGAIAVESETGQGTTFTVYLPASIHTKPELEPVHEPMPESPQHGRVLVMDDEDCIRMLVEKMLSKMGYQCDLAIDGQQALKAYSDSMAEGAPYDAVILDLTIPGGMGGKDVVGRIHEMNPDATVFVSSGYSSDPVLSRYKDYGFAGILSKPYSLAALNEVFRMVNQKSVSL